MAISSRWKNEWRSAVVAHRPRNRFATAHIPGSVFKPPRKRCRNRRNKPMRRMLDREDKEWRSPVRRSKTKGGLETAYPWVFILASSTLIVIAGLTALDSQASPVPEGPERIALIGGTAINPADGKVLPNASIVINGDKI